MSKADISINPNKKIVFINQDSGYLMIDIINAFVSKGYNCSLITGRLIERNTPLNKTVKVYRIVNYNRSSAFKRLFTWTYGFFQIWIKIVLKFRKDQLFIVSNPPIAPLLPFLVSNQFKLLIFDIYPDALYELGYFRENSLIIRIWRKLNKKVYSKAEKIFTITESMKSILQKYTGNVEVEVVSVWTDNTFFKPVIAEKNPFLLKHKLTDKFIVMYSGNIGLSGDVDTLIDVAAEIENENIFFLIIGDGAKKEKIQERATNLKLKNLILLPWQPVSELPNSFSSAGIAVISLGIKASKLAVPSKLYNFLSVGAPLLCITENGSEVESLVTKYNCGRCFNPSNIKGMANFILEVANDSLLHTKFKENSFKASLDFNLSNVNKFLSESNSN